MGGCDLVVVAFQEEKPIMEETIGPLPPDIYLTIGNLHRCENILGRGGCRPNNKQQPLSAPLTTTHTQYIAPAPAAPAVPILHSFVK